MALKGSITTNGYDGRKYTLSWTATQSIENNTSTVKWTVSCAGGDDSWYAERTLKAVINGTTVYSKTDRVVRYKDDDIKSGEITIAHGTDGSKSFSASLQVACYTSAVNLKASGSFTLDTIPRKSTLSASNGTLNTEQTLTVTQQYSGFTHTITYKCGSASGTICTKSKETSIKFTPPIGLANQNTTGTTVSVVFTITTYSGDTNIGSATKTITCSIPASVKPSCSLAVSDPTGYASTYGGYIKTLSKFYVEITPVMSYRSPISSIKATANGATYTKATFTTGVLNSAGTLKINATVTDKRGRSGSDSESLTVLDYTAPVISKLNVKRCNEDETENDQGEYVLVTFSGQVTSLNAKNSATYTLQYKSSVDEKYTTAPAADMPTALTVTDATYKFPANTSYSYDVLLVLADDFNETKKTTSASTGFTIMHFNSSGYGMAVGKISEIDGVFDIGFQARFNGGILHPVLEPETDLNDVRTPNTYVGANVTTYNYSNCPIDAGTFTLVVEGAGEEGQIRQKLTSCRKADARTFERFYYQSTWGEWVCTSDYAGTLLWSGSNLMGNGQNINLAEVVSKQKSGIVLVFSRYSSNAAQDYHFSCHFIPKYQIATHAGTGHTFLMSTDGSFGAFGSKYLYLHDDHIAGNAINTTNGTGNCGIIYDNGGFVLRYVIGV